MKIGILTLAIMEKGKEQKYNAQYIGLAKAMAYLGHKVIVYCMEEREDCIYEWISPTIMIKRINAKGIGIHSFFPRSKVDCDLDVMICFSDNQYSLPNVYKFCKKNNIELFPYVGVINSRNENTILKVVMDIFAKRNLKLYKKMIVFAKTKNVEHEMNKLGVVNTCYTPVCLDDTKLNKEYARYSKSDLRARLNLPIDSKIILFVGRLVEEKRPLILLEYFEIILSLFPDAYLCMIGTGNMQKDVQNKIEDLKIKAKVKMIDNVHNSEMWEYYCACDCMLNMNMGEIFGMAILEAMYYECPVVAYAAPGPSSIITDNIDGYLFKSDTECFTSIKKALTNGRLSIAHTTIEQNYMWKETACRMIRVIETKCECTKTVCNE